MQTLQTQCKTMLWKGEAMICVMIEYYTDATEQEQGKNNRRKEAVRSSALHTSANR